jgi:hypothetical protein
MKVYFPDNVSGGSVEGDLVYDSAGNLAARIEGEATPAEVGGAVLLLVLIRWLDGRQIWLNETEREA